MFKRATLLAALVAVGSFGCCMPYGNSQGLGGVSPAPPFPGAGASGGAGYSAAPSQCPCGAQSPSAMLSPAPAAVNVGVPG